MHDATQQMANSPHLYMRTWTEVPCLAPSKTPCGDTPARIELPPRLARISDALSVLKRKRDRYKGRGKMIQAATVQACIDELRGVWK